MDSLQVAWFVLLAVLFAGYAILDGYDLGAGFWHLGFKSKERSQVFKAITPFWDGNEVWLLTAGGALFAAFPPVYATVFSGFYMAMMLILLALISRAVGLEFREKLPEPGWQQLWDIVFSVGSILTPVLLGVGLGNIVRGIPLSPDTEFAGTFFGLLNPYALLFGVTVLAMFATHSATFLAWKTEKELYEKIVKRGKISWYVSFSLLALVMFITISFNTAKSLPLLIIAITTLVFSLLAKLMLGKRDAMAFFMSSLKIGMSMVFVAFAIFPHLVIDSNGGEGLHIANASSSPLTLKVMFILALIGMPIVLGYTVYVYKVFKGKVQA